MTVRIDWRIALGVCAVVVAVTGAGLQLRPDGNTKAGKLQENEAQLDEARIQREKLSPQPVSSFPMPSATSGPADGQAALEDALNSADPVSSIVARLSDTDPVRRNEALDVAFTLLLHVPEERRIPDAQKLAVALAPIVRSSDAHARTAAFQRLVSLFNAGLIDGSFFADAARNEDPELRERAFFELAESSRTAAAEIFLPLLKESGDDAASPVFAGIDQVRQLRQVSPARLSALIKAAEASGPVPAALAAAAAP